MVNTQVNLQTGMTRRQVLREAKQAGLDKESRKQIKLFFKNDDDKMITNGNELAVLNKLFGNTAEVVMPKENTKDGASVYTTQKGKTTKRDILFDADGNGNADSRTVQNTKTEKDGYQVTTADCDYDLDGSSDDKYVITFGSEEAIKKRNSFEDKVIASVGGQISTCKVSNGEKINTSGLHAGVTALTEGFDATFSINGGAKGLNMSMTAGHNFKLGTLKNGVTQVGINPYAGYSGSVKYKDSNVSVGDVYAGTAVTLRQSNPDKRLVFKAGVGIEAGRRHIDYKAYFEGSSVKGYLDKQTENKWFVQPAVDLHIADKKSQIAGNLRITPNTAEIGIGWEFGHLIDK